MLSLAVTGSTTVPRKSAKWMWRRIRKKPAVVLQNPDRTGWTQFDPDEPIQPHLTAPHRSYPRTEVAPIGGHSRQQPLIHIARPLGTGISLVPEHNPLVYAKQVATLSFFSGGRLIYGFRAGWLRGESELLGVDFPSRWSQTAEYIAAMRELWAKGEAQFNGKYVKFPAVRSCPKLIQQPGTPVLLGSKDKNALKPVAPWRDAWCSNRVDPGFMQENRAQLRDDCRARGRDYSKLDMTVMGTIRGETQGSAR